MKFINCESQFVTKLRADNLDDLGSLCVTFTTGFLSRNLQVLIPAFEIQTLNVRKLNKVTKV